MTFKEYIHKTFKNRVKKNNKPMSFDDYILKHAYKSTKKHYPNIKSNEIIIRYEKGYIDETGIYIENSFIKRYRAKDINKASQDMIKYYNMGYNYIIEEGEDLINEI